VNFFAHALVAGWTREHPRFLLGAMLPDLTSMLGERIDHLPDPEVHAGVDHHHAADGAFHGSPTFARLCSEAIARLGELGVGRGSARAVGHVGTELLLDGALSHDEAAVRRYTGALEHALEAPIEDLVRLREPGREPALHNGIARLMTAPVPHGYRDPEFVVARLHHMLARRPRLALRETDLSHVRDWARDTRATVAAEHERMLHEVASGLKNHAR
jgi:hypothetical protein